jgi:hypothetical protein
MHRLLAPPDPLGFAIGWPGALRVGKNTVVGLVVVVRFLGWVGS